MNRIANWKTAAVLLAGCVLALASGGPAGACPAKARYHAYGLGYTRVGPSWTYLGSYDTARDAEAAAKVARNRWGGAFAECRVVEGARLDLPPEPRCKKVVLFRLPGRSQPADKSGTQVGEFRTLAEAAAAARRIVAAGDRFEVLCWEV
jgi:hypothetical protein